MVKPYLSKKPGEQAWAQPPKGPSNMTNIENWPSMMTWAAKAPIKHETVQWYQFQSGHKSDSNSNYQLLTQYASRLRRAICIYLFINNVVQTFNLFFVLPGLGWPLLCLHSKFCLYFYEITTH